MESVLDDDRPYWERAIAGDERAIAALFDRHHERVYRHARAILRSESEADDVMAATFFEMWRRRAAVRIVDRSVLPWLLATATLLCRNSARASARYGALLRRLPRDPPSDPLLLAEERAERAQQSDSLRAALRRLSPVDAELVVLTAVAGLTTEEAAIAVGVLPGNARVKLHRARRRLRQLLNSKYSTTELEERTDGEAIPG